MDEYMTANIRISDLERCNADLDALESENAKLRELVLDFVNDLYSDATLEYPHTFLRRYARRLKEVGIEV